MAATPERTTDARDRALKRERAARKQAETLLERRSRELYLAGEELKVQNSALKRRAEELELLHLLAMETQAERTPDELLARFVEQVCLTCGWPIGHLWRVSSDAPDHLTATDIWHFDEPERFADLRASTAITEFVSGDGIPGRVLERREPVWVDNLGSGQFFPRTQAAIRLGVEAGLGVPISVDRRVAAVAEFFLCGTRVYDEQMVRLTQIAAAQVGGALERLEQAEALQRNYSDLKRMHAELGEAQAQLLQSEKLASLGQMAAGVAHEINNPIGFVSSNLGTLAEYVSVFKRLLGECDSLLESDGHRDEALQRIDRMREAEDFEFISQDIDELLTESREGMTRVRDIVLGLKSFARIDEIAIQPVDINECVEATLKMVWNEIKFKCSVDTALGQLPPVTCHAGQINQVLTNLLVNGAQAIESRGNLRIVTAFDEPGEQVTIQVSDDGAGIEPENLSKLFNPFFTTKPVGEGTGLGLSVSYGIVDRHGGTLSVESAVGEGTTFTVALPLRPPDETALASA